MKLLLDLQGAQSQSRHRGIGRYTLALARAVLEQATPQHDLRLLLNGRFEQPADGLIATLGKYADREHRIVLDVPEGIRAQPGGNGWLRQAAAHSLRHALENIPADIVWFSSVLEGYNDDALLPDRPPAGMASVATVYDLIPLHDAQSYLGHPRVRQWYEQSVQLFKRCGLLLAISEWVRRDAIERLGLAPERVVTIGAAADESFRAPPPDPRASDALRRRYGIDRPYVLYNGGFDSRKNVPRLIEAFATLPDALRARYQLVIVGRASEEERAQLDAATRRAQLPAGQLVYTGFAPDPDLVRLYAECALFVFPSLQEGFGLPPLEAMACGAPVIASDAASLPEVVDRRDAQFDPRRVDRMGERMAAVLDNPALADELRQYAKARAAQFSWNTVADRALEALQALAGQQRARRASTAVAARSNLTCIVAEATQAPAWLGELGATTMAAAQAHGASAAPVPPADDTRLLYVTHARGAASLAPLMRLRPGALLMVDDTDYAPPALDTDYDRTVYEVNGYAGLLAVRAAQDTPDLRLLPLLRYATIAMCVNERIAQPLRQAATAAAHPQIVTLPTDAPAQHCRQQLADACAAHPLAREAKLFDEIASVAGDPHDHDLAALSSSIASSRARGGTRRWLVDVSSIANTDLGTGVPRVVRHTLLQWLRHAPYDVRVEPVRFSQGRFRYARRYTLDLLGLTDVALAEDAVDVADGDTFVGLDWAMDTIAQAEPQLRDWHRRGVGMHFLVHDLLPLSLPEMFHPYARNRFEDWLRRIAGMADQLVCVSRTTADALSAWMGDAGLAYQFGAAPRVSHAPLGVDPMSDAPAAAPRRVLAEAMQARPTLLMVGTLEPRKGHEQALAACDLLWQQGADFNLVIVGHFGWLMESFLEKLQRHPQHNRRLFWIDDAEDAELHAIYTHSTALLAASWGEGYGLPLIEAARHQLPVIARDIPVFREVMGEHAHYVTAPDAPALSAALREWLDAPYARTDMGATWPGWKESASYFATVIQAV